MYPNKTLITNSYRAVCPDSPGPQTPPSGSRRHSRNTGSYDVTGLQVPVLAYDDTSVTLVWNKPENYESVEDYRIYLDGKPIGRARENFAKHADRAYTYMKAFYEH